MAILTTKTRSRRTLLAGTVRGLVALAAGALGRPQPVRADGQPILVGGEYDTAVSKTSLRNKANAAVVFQASSDSFGIGVQGSSGTGIGVRGSSNSYYGVHGSSSSGQGIYGFSSTSAGVEGFSNSAAGARGLSNLNRASLGSRMRQKGMT